MRPHVLRGLAAAVVTLALLSLAERAPAGPVGMSTCCQCVCPGGTTQCLEVGSPVGCMDFFETCLSNGCEQVIGNGSCTAVPVCTARQAPLLSGGSLTLIAAALACLGVLVLRRRHRQPNV